MKEADREVQRVEQELKEKKRILEEKRKALEKGGNIPVPTGSGVPAPAPASSSVVGAMPASSSARADSPAVPSGRGRGAGKGRGGGAGSAPAHQGGSASPGNGTLGVSSRGLPRGGRGKKGGRKGFNSSQTSAPQQTLYTTQQYSHLAPQSHISPQTSSFALHPPGPPPFDLAGSLFALGKWARQMGPCHPGGGAAPVPLATSSPVAPPAPRAQPP